LQHLGITFIIDLVAYKLEQTETISQYPVDSVNYGININDRE